MANGLELDEIQGLIMSGYKHLHHAKYLLLQFTDAALTKDWLRLITPQIETGREWQKHPVTGVLQKPMAIINLGLGYSGLKMLGLPQEALNSFPEDFRDGVATNRRSRILGDHGESAPEKWQIGSDQSTLHAMLVIVTADNDLLQQEYDKHKALLAAYAIGLLAEETGHRLEGDREHFGFLDGVSQPCIEGSPRDSEASEPTIKPGEFVLGYPNQYGHLPDSPILNGTDLGRNGSYVVFRKLYQDVVGFWNFIAQHAADESDEVLAPMPPSERELWLASRFFGRWPSGAPTVKYRDADRPDIPKSEMNDFYYWKRDFDGLKCPRGSHIRRANPRDTNGTTPENSLATSDSHLIIRRGLSYGKPLTSPQTLPPQGITDDGEDRGLIFLAINASISRQFEFVHQSWLNNTKFDRLYNDKDPIIGDNRDKNDGDSKRYDLTIERDPVRRRITGLTRFVIVRGGGYFFMPSISALNLIASV